MNQIKGAEGPFETRHSPVGSLTPTAPATAATAAAAAATTAVTVAAFLGFVHPKSATVKRCAIHLGDGLRGVLRRTHRHKGEAARLPAVSVGDDVYVGHFAEGRECTPDGFRRRLERQVANIEPVTHWNISSR
jgi:hypothetical protein